MPSSPNANGFRLLHASRSDAYGSPQRRATPPRRDQATPPRGNRATPPRSSDAEQRSSSFVANAGRQTTTPSSGGHAPGSAYNKLGGNGSSPTLAPPSRHIIDISLGEIINDDSSFISSIHDSPGSTILDANSTALDDTGVEVSSLSENTVEDSAKSLFQSLYNLFYDDSL